MLILTITFIQIWSRTCFWWKRIDLLEPFQMKNVLYLLISSVQYESNAHLDFLTKLITVISSSFIIHMYMYVMCVCKCVYICICMCVSMYIFKYRYMFSLLWIALVYFIIIHYLLFLLLLLPFLFIVVV